MGLIDFLGSASWLLFGIFAIAFVVYGVLDWLTERRPCDGRSMLDVIRERKRRR